jgi:hypothetical protein
MTREQGGVGMSIFLAIAIVEHIIFVLVLAVIVYTEPAPKPDNPPIRVDIILNEQEEKKKLEAEISVASLPLKHPVTDELPPIHFTHNRQSYPDASQSTGGLPDLPRGRRANRNSDRFSLDAALPQGRKRDLVDDSSNPTVRAKPLVEQVGHYGHERRGAPETNTQRHTRGERGHNPTGRLAAGSLVDTRTDQITGGAGYEIRIYGEVSGRGVHLGPALQTEGKQGGGVQLSFKVRPDGTVYHVRIKPGPKTTIGEVRLKRKAIQYVQRVRFERLPKNAPQVNQSGEIFIRFTTQTNR